MQLVILAAGHGRRFGGLKQLAPVGPHGEAIMDYTARSAAAIGYDGVVVVVREEIREEIARHIRRSWPASLPAELVCQPATPGTAQAVLAARPVLGHRFGVANADDLYGSDALRLLRAPIADAGGAGGGGEAPHLLVAYRLVQTILTAAPVTRGVCEVSESGSLQAIAEHRVEPAEAGGFVAVPLDVDRPTRHLGGQELVSMNLWGFESRILDRLEEALERFVPGQHGRRELLLPDVVGRLVAAGEDEVRVVVTTSRCIGVTHQEDLALVGEELAATPPDPAEPGTEPDVSGAGAARATGWRSST